MASPFRSVFDEAGPVAQDGHGCLAGDSANFTALLPAPFRFGQAWPKDSVSRAALSVVEQGEHSRNVRPVVIVVTGCQLFFESIKDVFELVNG